MSHDAEKKPAESEWNVEQHSNGNQVIKQLSFGTWLKAGGNERLDLTLSSHAPSETPEKAKQMNQQIWTNY